MGKLENLEWLCDELNNNEKVRIDLIRTLFGGPITEEEDMFFDDPIIAEVDEILNDEDGIADSSQIIDALEVDRTNFLKEIANRMIKLKSNDCLQILECIVGIGAYEEAVRIYIDDVTIEDEDEFNATIRENVLKYVEGKVLVKTVLNDCEQNVKKKIEKHKK